MIRISITIPENIYVNIKKVYIYVLTAIYYDKIFMINL